VSAGGEVLAVLAVNTGKFSLPIPQQVDFAGLFGIYFPK